MTDGLKSIRELLQSKYYIPSYQRNYVWTTEKNRGMVTDFWNDLQDFHNIKCEEIERYLLGSIIVHSKKDKETDNTQKFIIDGQQRLTTIIIYLIAARDIQKDIATSDGKIVCNDADNCYTDIKSLIGRTADNPSKDSLKLNVALENQSFFRDCLMNGNPVDTKKCSKSQKNMINAYNLFKKELYNMICKNQIVNHTSEESAIIENITNTLLDNFKIFFIETYSLKEAYLTFSTLNNRGKPLKQADLLKNYLFSQCNPNGDNAIVEKSWNEMVSNLKDTDEDVSQFIRYHWTSKHKSVTMNLLFHNISIENDTPDKTYNFIQDLNKTSKLYAYCIDPINKENVIKNSAIEEIVKNLKIMNFKIYIPLMIALQNEDIKIPISERIEILKIIESLAFRNVVTMGQHTGPIWSSIISCANSIQNNNYNFEEIKNEFISLRVDDNTFKENLFKKKYSSNEIPKMILKKIYNSKELNVNSGIELEHILPKSKSNIKKNWSHIDPKVHDEYKCVIGNMTLLMPEDNKQCSDNSFEDKKNNVYSKSKLEENKKLATIPQWNKKTIEEREKELNKIIVKMW